MLELFSTSLYLYVSLLSDISVNLNLLADGITDKGLASLGAGITGVGMIGASIGQGIVGAGACVAIGRNPEAAKQVMSVMFIIAGFSESGAIYALLIGILLLFVV